MTATTGAATVVVKTITGVTGVVKTTSKTGRTVAVGAIASGVVGSTEKTATGVVVVVVTTGATTVVVGSTIAAGVITVVIIFSTSNCNVGVVVMTTSSWTVTGLAVVKRDSGCSVFAISSRVGSLTIVVSMPVKVRPPTTCSDSATGRNLINIGRFSSSGAGVVVVEVIYSMVSQSQICECGL